MSARIRIHGKPPAVDMQYDLDRRVDGVSNIEFRPMIYVMCVDGMAVLDDPPPARRSGVPTLRLVHANSNVDTVTGRVDCASEGRIYGR
ncbi:hypothetical protein [Roseicella sp. DB1501]|uniref:hypothetical protein n=1 Tax=Roseicella sp. DB1501 TaxID=2730925 RepID=UPI0014921F1D|nr:hypothetical protein [Roseicella sp. DB1501]NOG73728.1 hypothetical protein [Roseicella sp. DB1501]